MKNHLMIIVLVMYSQILYAEPYIIYETSQTVSTQPYKAVLSGTQPIESEHYASSWMFSALPDVLIDENQPDDDLFPIITQKLTPQYLDENIESSVASLPSPLCIVGSDSLSMAWVEKNLDHLREINAHCLLVEADSAEVARDVLNALDGISLYPAKGDQLADYFKIHHYPVLISQRVITQ